MRLLTLLPDPCLCSQHSQSCGSICCCVGILTLLPSIQSLPQASAEGSWWDNHGTEMVSAALFCRAERQGSAVFCTSSSSHPEPPGLWGPVPAPVATPRCPVNAKTFTAQPLLVSVAEPRAGLGTRFLAISHQIFPSFSQNLEAAPQGVVSTC